MTKYRIGQKYRVKDTYCHKQLRGLIGTIVKDNNINLFLDFDKTISTLTWDMTVLRTQTGRIMDEYDCELIEPDWDE